MIVAVVIVDVATLLLVLLLLRANYTAFQDAVGEETCVTAAHLNYGASDESGLDVDG